MKQNKYLIAFFSLLISTNIFAQHLQVGSVGDQYLRELQLLDSSSVYNSFTIRPIALPLVKMDSSFLSIMPKQIEQDFLPGKLFYHPLMADLSFNSFRPFGWNNGSMITARGFQSRITAGVLYSSKFFDVNVQPEIVNAVNPNYTTSTSFGNPTNGPYSKIFLGQSYAELKLGRIGMGFSNENIWLGPGQQSALIMSNNAPGFGHIYLKTREPIRTPILDLEFNVYGGGLDQDSLLNSESNFQRPIPFSRQWRYLNNISLTIQPKFIPGLYLGFNRTLQFYGNKEDSSTVGFFNKYVPAVSAFFRKKINTQADAPSETDGQDQIASFFMRFVFPKEHFEIYFEYGYNDFKANTRDLIQDAQHSSAYIAGFKKMIPTSKGVKYSIAGEIVQMAQSSDYTTRNAGNWYGVGSGSIRQGMTHYNQVLGAGSGVGNNVQSLHVERIEALNRYGFKIMRIQNDPKGLTGSINTMWLNPIAWSDFIYGPSVQIDKKKFLIRGEMLFVHSKNYAWMTENKFNLFTSINCIYKW
jgi:hypothetical protein